MAALEARVDELDAYAGMQAGAMSLVNPREIVDEVLTDLAATRADGVHVKIGHGGRLWAEARSGEGATFAPWRSLPEKLGAPLSSRAQVS